MRHILIVLAFCIATLFFGCCNNGREIIYSYDWVDVRRAPDNTIDSVLGTVELPILQFRSKKLKNQFDRLFEELSNDTISDIYDFILLDRNDTMYFAIQDRICSSVLEDELKIPGTYNGIVRYRNRSEARDFFVRYSIKGKDTVKYNGLFRRTGKLLRYELRKHYLPPGISIMGSCESQSYRGYFTDDSIRLFFKKERR